MNINVEQTLDEIISGFNSKEIIVWCGSGISRNSGIPVVNPFLDYLLNRIDIKEQDKKTILDSNLPFEKYIEILNDNCQADKLFDIYDADKPQINSIKPNTNHIFVAKLAKANLLKVIVTTNFDQLIEKALQNEGLKERKDYEVIYKEDDFNKINWHSNKINLIKIHGSISDRKNMVITLKKVAQKELSIEREKVIKKIFTKNINNKLIALISNILRRTAAPKNNHQNVLILGYSSSDVFDLCPQIESIENNLSNVYYIEHIAKNEIPYVENIINKTDKNPFKKFNNSYRLFYNTDKFIENIWNKLILNANYEYIEDNILWQTNIDDWFKTNESFTKYQLSFRILWEISEFKRSIIYAETALAIVKQNGNRNDEPLWLSNLGNAYMGLAEYSKSLENFELALKIAEEIGNIKNTILYLNSISMVYYRLGDNKKALEYSSKATERTQKIKNSKNEKNDPVSMGVIYWRSGEYDKAINCFQEAIDNAVKKGDKKEEGMWLGNLGVIYKEMNKNVEAERYINNALTISVSIGDKSNECKCIGNLGDIYINLQQYKKGIEYLNKALAIAEEIGDNYTKVIWLGNIGNAYNFLRDYSNAKNYCEQALKICKQIGDKDSEIRNLGTIGQIHFHSNDNIKAIEYYEKAIKISVEIGSNHMHGKLLTCLGDVYSNSQDINKSIGYYRKALDILIPLLGVKHSEVKNINDCINNLIKPWGRKRRAY